MDDKRLSRFRNEKIGIHIPVPPSVARVHCIGKHLPACAHRRTQHERRIETSVAVARLYETLAPLLAPAVGAIGREQQRVAIARALINRPSVVFADEPSINLDSRNADQLHHLFLDLREQHGQTFVIVTHNESLAQMADRKLEMRDGRIERIIDLKTE